MPLSLIMPDLQCRTFVHFQIASPTLFLTPHSLPSPLCLSQVYYLGTHVNLKGQPPVLVLNFFSETRSVVWNNTCRLTNPGASWDLHFSSCCSGGYCDDRHFTTPSFIWVLVMETQVLLTVPQSRKLTCFLCLTSFHPAFWNQLEYLTIHFIEVLTPAGIRALLCEVTWMISVPFSCYWSSLLNMSHLPTIW